MDITIQGGLYLHDPSVAPPGACIRAKNVVFDKDGVVLTRNGSSKGSITGTSAVLYMFDHSGDRYTWSSTRCYKNETVFGDTLTAARPEAVRYNAYNSTQDSMFFLNGTDRKRVEGTSMYEWGTDAPTTAPTIAAGDGSGLTGDYNVKYTFLRKEGSVIVYESNFSPTATSAVELSDEDLDVTGIEVPSDSQITHIRIYRTTAGGSLYYKETDITAGTTSVTLDDSDATITLNSLEHDNNHNRPPLGTHCAGPFFNGYIFVLKDNLLHWCLAQRPEYFPLNYYVEISEPQDPGQAIVDYNGMVFVFTREKIVQLQGSGSNSFYPITLEAFTGTYSSSCVHVIPNRGIFHLGKDGIYLFSGRDNKALPELDPIFDQTSTDGLPNLDVSKISYCWMESLGSSLFFAYPSTSATSNYPDVVVRIDTTTGKVSRFDYTGVFSASLLDKTNRRLYTGDSSGYVWQLETGSTDNGTAISIEVETPQINTPTREFSPRACRYDTYCDANDTLNASVIIDGTSVQTHALSNVNRNTRPRLITDTVGNRVSMRFTGSGPNIKIYARQEIE